LFAFSDEALHADVPSALCYFVFFGAQTITSTISMLTAAALLDRGHLYMPLMLNFPVGLLCLLALLAIHLVTSKDSASHKDQETRDIPSIKSSIRNLVNVLRDTNVLALLATVPVAKSISPIGELTWQYIPKRFRVSLSDVGPAPAHGRHS
jgi:cobalamin biosynthesis protein CobD/CbiB